VLGTGIDVCYPKENKKLFEKVLEKGATISELPTGSHPAPGSFPVRNCIIAGMPLGVIVEGKQYSGSLITARLAMEFGREVFGVPGNVTQEMSFAPNQLIKQGMKVVTSAEDVIEDLPTPIRAALVQAEAMGSAQRNLLAGDGLNPTEKNTYELLSIEAAKPIGEIIESTGLNSSDVLATLFDLEMKGIIRQLPGEAVRPGIVVSSEEVTSAALAQCIGRKAWRIRSGAQAARRGTYKGSEKDTAPLYQPFQRK
jgi:DNA processing protein